MSNSFRNMVEEYPNNSIGDYLRYYLSYHGDEIETIEMLRWIETIEWFLKKRIEERG